MNGQQSILLTPIALVLTLALSGVVFTVIAVIAQAIVAASMRPLAARTAPSGLHFICRTVYC